jgi:hypothetical protein
VHSNTRADADVLNHLVGYAWEVYL